LCRESKDASGSELATNSTLHKEMMAGRAANGTFPNDTLPVVALAVPLRTAMFAASSSEEVAVLSSSPSSLTHL